MSRQVIRESTCERGGKLRPTAKPKPLKYYRNKSGKPSTSTDNRATGHEATSDAWPTKVNRTSDAIADEHRGILRGSGRVQPRSKEETWHRPLRSPQCLFGGCFNLCWGILEDWPQRSTVLVLTRLHANQGSDRQSPKPKRHQRMETGEGNPPTKGKGTTQRKRAERKGQRQSSRKRTECSVRNTRSKFV